MRDAAEEDALSGIPADSAGPVGAPDTAERTETPDTAGRASDRARHLRRDLVLLAVGGALLVVAVALGGSWLYQSLYSPAAFVDRYLHLIAAGRAADALAVPGVAIDRTDLSDAALPTDASDALLRAAALAPLTDIRIVSERRSAAATEVTAAYRAGGHPGRTTFQVRSNGWIGVAPSWRFVRTPLAVIDLSVHGSMTFRVNGFSIDKRQVSSSGAQVDPAAPLPMLVFSPGLYAVSVRDAAASSETIAIVSDSPMKDVPAVVQAQPTAAFVSVVQQRVTEFLTQCATQQVLQPTGCPFGYIVDNRIQGLPRWSLVSQPQIALLPDGENWRISPVDGVAHIVVDVRSIYDGSLQHVDEDVPFSISGTVVVGADGAATINVVATDTD